MDKFKLNSKVEVMIDDDRATGLLHDSDDNNIYISIPTLNRDFKILREGDTVFCVVYDENELVGFDAEVTSRKSGEVPIYGLSNFKNFTKVQRREYVRVSYSGKIQYSNNKFLLNIKPNEYNNMEKLEKVEKYLKDGIILDISGGGIRFSSDERMNIGEELILKFYLGDILVFNNGEIVYKNLDIINGKSKYTYGVKFSGIDDKVREAVINFVFILMRKNRLR